MICAQLIDPGNGAPAYFAPAPSQPADFSACQAVILTGADTGTLSIFSFPTPADAATAWGWGFTLVVGAYAIGWSVGAVVNFINKH